jgi:hypothetical protein
MNIVQLFIRMTENGIGELESEKTSNVASCNNLEEEFNNLMQEEFSSNHTFCLINDFPFDMIKLSIVLRLFRVSHHDANMTLFIQFFLQSLEIRAHETHPNTQRCLT